MVRTLALRGEMNRLGSQALLRTSRLESLIQVHDGSQLSWSLLRLEPWLSDYWAALGKRDLRELYAAVTDPSGTIVLHTDPALIGRQLKHGWYDRRVPEAGGDVLYAETSPLADQAAAYDQRFPITVGGKWIGDYHEGLDARWFEAYVADQQREVLVGWLWVLGLGLLVNAAAAWGLVQLIGNQRRLSGALRRGVEERARQLVQIGSGLAHEIRNPLHALRLNLHTLKRALGPRPQLSPDQVAATVHESDIEINRLDGLLHDLLQYTAPRRGERGDLDVSREMQATLNLLSEDLRRNEVQIRADLTQQPVVTPVDPVRLRQIILNLLTFAQHNAGKGGLIEVEVVPRGEQVEIAVADGGPTLTSDQQDHVFEPFQAPASTGSGLGLALVQCFAEEAGGGVSCERRSPSGNRLRVRLPLAKGQNSGVSS